MNETELNAILAILPGAVIAGGFIRDSLLKKPTRDLDILTEITPTNQQIQALEEHLKTDLYEFSLQEAKEYIAEEGNSFTRTSDIVKLWKDEGNNVVDLIVVQNVKQHIREFPDNLSRVWYDKDGLHMMSDFIYGHANKVLRYRKGAPEARLEKLKTKFPDYRVELTLA